MKNQPLEIAKIAGGSYKATLLLRLVKNPLAWITAFTVAATIIGS